MKGLVVIAIIYIVYRWLQGLCASAKLGDKLNELVKKEK